MDSTQRSIYTMGRQVLDDCKANQAIVNSIPGLPGLQTDLENTLTDIFDTNRDKQVDIRGIVVQKQKQRADSTSDAMAVSAIIVAYATMANDTVLAQKARYTTTDFTSLSDSECATAFTGLFVMATQYLVQLQPYGMTADKLTEYQTSIAAFMAVIDAPKEAHMLIAQLTNHLAGLFVTLLNILDKMDILVELLKNNQPVFYASYHSTRTVVYHQGSLMARGKITDSVTKLGIGGAKISFVINGKEVLVKMSATAGGFNIKSIAEGSYTVTISRVGYVTQTVTMHIPNGKIAVLNVALVSL